MMLDLIGGSKLTWEQALVKSAEKGAKMPMSMKNAIMASRIENSEYNENYMPHKYLYEHWTYDQYSSAARYSNDEIKGHYSAASELLDKEMELTKDWLLFVYPGITAEDFDIWISEEGQLENVFNKIEESCKTWFNIDLQDS